GDDKGARGPAKGEAAADAVSEAQIRADAGHEAGGEAALPQDVVHQVQGEVIRVGAGQAQVPNPNLTLGQIGAVQEIDAGGAELFRRRGEGLAGGAAAA